MQRDGDRLNDGEERTSSRAADAAPRPLPGGDVTVDEMSEASFPASDAPARWTWELAPTVADDDGSDEA